MKKADELSHELKLSDVEETGLLTLYCRAIESQSPNPILVDEKAQELVKRIDPLLEGSSNRLLNRMQTRRIDPKLVVHIALRSRRYDRYAVEFLSGHPDGVIVNLGCGLDTRFYRIDDGSMIYFDLDLPDVIAAKRKLLAESERYKMIAGSLLETKWMDEIRAIGSRPIMFLAEGVFMYLPEEKVKRLVLGLQQRFPGCELVCEVVNRAYAQGFFKQMTALKMQSRLDIGGQAQFIFGVSDKRELEGWGDGIQFLDEWSYFDSGHEKLGILRAFAGWQLFRHAQYTVHYRLSG